MKKRMAVLGMAAALAIPTCAVNVSAEEEAVKIGFLAPSLQTEFMIGIDDGLKAGCGEEGWEYMSVSFEGDSATAVTQIENMTMAGCTIIVAMVSDSSCDDALAEAQEEGVTVVEIGTVTEVWDICLNTDQYGVGEAISEMAAEWINEDLNGEANVVMYTTLQSEDGQNRGKGMEEKLKELCPDVNLLEVVDIGKDVVGSGTSTTESMLQKYPELNCIISYGDASATESVEAVKAAGVDPETFGIFSCDGTAAAINNIANGNYQRGTIAWDPIADQALDAIRRYQAGETFDDYIPISSTAIVAENVADYVTE